MDYLFCWYGQVKYPVSFLLVTCFSFFFETVNYPEVWRQLLEVMCPFEALNVWESEVGAIPFLSSVSLTGKEEIFETCEHHLTSQVEKYHVGRILKVGIYFGR